MTHNKTNSSGAYTNLKALLALRFEARGFSFHPRQLMRNPLHGRYAARLRGRGLNFEELRQYQMGDDIRNIDWKVTNRMRKPFVRSYTEEEERASLLLVDQRTSMFFGSQRQMKSVTAAECAALIAWRMISEGDRVGGIVFGDEGLQEYKPHHLQSTLVAFLRGIEKTNQALSLSSPPATTPCQMAHALQEAGRLTTHDQLIVLITDLSGWSAQSYKTATGLAQHNDLVVLHVVDPLEAQLPTQGQMPVSDGVLQMELDASKPKLRTEFARSFETRTKAISQDLAKHGVAVVPISTAQEVAPQLRQAFGHRKMKR